MQLSRVVVVGDMVSQSEGRGKFKLSLKSNG